MFSLDDYTRVVLEPPGGDYINASYIKVSRYLVVYLWVDGCVCLSLCHYVYVCACTVSGVSVLMDWMGVCNVV